MKRFFIVMISIVFIISGCNLPAAATTVTEEPATQLPPSPEPTSEPTAPVLETIVPPTEASIVHIDQPGELPSNRAGHAGDYDSSITAGNKTSGGGDRFTFGRFERPFNADTMDTYFPHLDIVDTLIYQDNMWLYGVITLRSTDDNEALSGTYGVEFDLNLDGKGDWLILADQPASEEWTTDGVRVYYDTNRDVGGLLPTLTDDPPVFSDGFENKVFDSGMGDDPDLAWVRISPDDPHTIYIAIKRNILDGTGNAYLVGMWAGNEDLDPFIFDHNDHYTHEEAGAADKGLEFFYPVKQISELDNSCRMAVGFQPTGNEPGLCPVLVEDNPPEGCPGEPPNGCGPYPNFWNPSICSCDVVEPPG